MGDKYTDGWRALTIRGQPSAPQLAGALEAREAASGPPGLRASPLSVCS